MIIERREKKLLGEGDEWILVYGRRKTGKTFILRHYFDWDLYLTVTRGGQVIIESKAGDLDIKSMREAIQNIPTWIEKGKNVVIDEFQRIPVEFWDMLSISRYRGRGRLILCGSSLSIVNKVFDKRSPLLGIFKPIHIDLIHPGDILREFLKKFRVRDAVIWGVLARDPWILGLVEPVKDPTTTLINNYKWLTSTVGGLIGEVFEEEGRKLTRLYDAVLRLLATGHWSSDQLTHSLHNSGLIEKYESGIVTGILNQLTKMGFVDKLKLLYTRGARTYYRHRSSLLSLLLYIDERFGYTYEEPSKEDIDSRLGLETQFFIGEILSIYKRLGLGYMIMPGGEGDIDIILLSKGKPVIAYEFKIGSFSRIEANRAVKKIRQYGIHRVGLISLSEKPPEVADESLGPEEIVQISQRL